MVALIFVVLAAYIEGIGDGAPVVIWHLGIAAAVRLLLLALHHETLVPITVWGLD